MSSAEELDGSPEGARLEAEASGNSRIYQAGRDQHIYLRDGTQRLRRTSGSATGDECPYPGLAAFDSTQAQWFFGRDGLTADLVSRVAESLTAGGVVMVVAPSGAGKSSLLQAGLRTAIKQGALPAAGSREWPHIVFTPTADPLRNAARHLAELDDSGWPETASPGSAELTSMLHRGLAARAQPGQPTAKAVIIVDQLEEVFTLCGSERDRREFIDWLCELARPQADGLPPAVVVCGLRADFYAECANYLPLREALAAGQVLVGPMSPAELREAVVFPAQAAGLEIESGLVELLLRDLGGESAGKNALDPGAGSYDAGRLPLLAHALQATWQQRHGSTLTVDGYNATGGIQHAIATTAERAFSTLDAAGQESARAVFLRLIKISDTGEDTRRPVLREALLSDSRQPADVKAVLDAYTRSRLLTQARDTVEITHEALIRAWPRLRHWIDEDRAGNLIRQDLEEAATAWNRDRRDAGGLHRGTRLDTARRWAAAPGHDLSTAGAAFLEASVGYARRAARLRRAAVTALAVSLVIAIGLAGWASVQQHKADSARNQADSERNQAIIARDQAIFQQTEAEGLQLAGSDTSLAAELDLAAYRMKQAPDPALAARLLSLENTPLATSIPVGHGAVHAVALSPDNRTLAIGSYDGTIELWDVADTAKPHLEAALRYLSSSVTSLAFNATGSILAAGSYSNGIAAWNVTDPAHLHLTYSYKLGYVDQIAFSADGRTLAVLYSDSAYNWDSVQLLDASSWQLIGDSLATDQGITDIGYCGDGRLLAGADFDKTIWLWDPANPATRYHFGQPQAATEATNIAAIACSPDGRTLAVGGNSGRIHLWDIADPAAPRSLAVLTGGTDPVFGLQYSRDGRVLVSSDQDGAIQQWDVIDRGRPEPIGPPVSGGSGSIQAAALTPDGHLLASGSATGTVQVWSLPRTMLPASAPVNSVALSPHGHVLVTGNNDGTIQLWDVTSPTRPSLLGQPIPAGIGAVWSVAFSPDGTAMATSGGDDGQIQLWNVTDPAHPQSEGKPFYAGYEQIWSVAFSPQKGRRILASASAHGSGDDVFGTVRLWDVTDLAHPRPLGPPLPTKVDNANSISFSSDGTMLAFGGWGTLANRNSGIVELWNVASTSHPKLIKDIITGTDQARSTALSPDRQILASGNYDGTIGYWPAIQAPGKSFEPQIGGVFALAFSPDNQKLAVGGATGLEVWNISSLGQSQQADRSQSLTGYNSWITSLTFSGSSLLISGSEDDTVRLWDLNVNDAIARICNTTGNVLTLPLWRKYFPGRPYQPPCRN